MARRAEHAAARAFALLSVAVGAGCASGAAPGSAATSGVGNAIVIADAAIDPARGSILAILQDHVRGMSYSRLDECPHIVLRGGGGRSQGAEPLVYVDGQRFSDTCILETLNLEAIGSIEVYPSGVTQRPGYTTNTGGLILVFTKLAGRGR